LVDQFHTDSLCAYWWASTVFAASTINVSSDFSLRSPVSSFWTIYYFFYSTTVYFVSVLISWWPSSYFLDVSAFNSVVLFFLRSATRPFSTFLPPAAPAFGVFIFPICFFSGGGGFLILLFDIILFSPSPPLISFFSSFYFWPFFYWAAFGLFKSAGLDLPPVKATFGRACFNYLGFLLSWWVTGSNSLKDYPYEDLRDFVL